MNKNINSILFEKNNNNLNIIDKDTSCYDPKNMIIKNK